MMLGWGWDHSIGVVIVVDVVRGWVCALVGEGGWGELMEVGVGVGGGEWMDGI